MKQKVERKPRLSMFVGVDVSGSFLRSQHYENALEFLAHYIYGHINGLGEMEVPAVLFVGEIGGSDVGEPKTLFPIHTFQGKSISEIHRQLKDIFPRRRFIFFTSIDIV